MFCILFDISHRVTLAAGITSITVTAVLLYLWMLHQFQGSKHFAQLLVDNQIIVRLEKKKQYSIMLNYSQFALDVLPFNLDHSYGKPNKTD